MLRWTSAAKTSALVSLAVGVAAAVAAPLDETERYGGVFLTYAQVDRTDGTYRRMLTTAETLAAATPGAPLPDGSRILMETYYRPGQVSIVFPMEKVGGRWRYGSFSGQGAPDLSTRPQASCLACHAEAAETDFTFTRPALDAARDAGLSRLVCDGSGRSPCAPSVYRPGAAR